MFWTVLNPMKDYTYYIFQKWHKVMIKLNIKTVAPEGQDKNALNEKNLIYVTLLRFQWSEAT